MSNSMPPASSLAEQAHKIFKLPAYLPANLPQRGVRLLRMEPGAQLGSWCLKLCSLHDGAVHLFLVFSGAWICLVLSQVSEMILLKR